jgi:hypothetical protein
MNMHGWVNGHRDRVLAYAGICRNQKLFFFHHSLILFLPSSELIVTRPVSHTDSLMLTGCAKSWRLSREGRADDAQRPYPTIPRPA